MKQSHKILNTILGILAGIGLAALLILSNKTVQAASGYLFAQYQTSSPNYTTGPQTVPLLTDSAANLKVTIASSSPGISFAATSTIITNPSSTPVQVTLATQIAGEDLTNNILVTELRYSYSFMSTVNTTTTIKSAAGFLHECTIEPIAGATTTVITIYDSTTGSGTKIASYQLQEPATALYPITNTLNVTYATGLSIVQTGATSTITCSYR
jgi:hypothetical protein